MIAELGLNNGGTNDAAEPKSECAGKREEGEKRTKVGHSADWAGIGGNVYLQDGWESLPFLFLLLSRSAFVFHMFRFLSRRERQHMGPNFQLLSLSPSTPIPYHSPHLLSLRRRCGILLRRNEKHNGPNVGIVRRVGRSGDIFPPFSHRSAVG